MVRPFKDWKAVKAADYDELIAMARELSWKNVGKELQAFVPGRMIYMKKEGRYPTISITGVACALNCDHCQRKILKTMIPATDPEELYKACMKVSKEGNIGVLISGGSLKDGSMPWKAFVPAISRVKKDTDLKVTVHTGLIDKKMAMALADAGVDEFLIDVMGSEETMRQVYHMDAGMDRMQASLDALASTGVPLIPHMVFGLHYGKVKGEMKALEMVAKARPYAVVIVVLIPLKGSPMDGLKAPDPKDVARFIAAVRFRLPDRPIALSCARPTGKHRRALDVLAVEAGVNRIAMPAEEAVERAKQLGLKVQYYSTCCSKSY